MKRSSHTSWQKVGKWYNQSVGESGHYYHQSVILPNVLKLLNFSQNQPASLLDLGCGQGVLGRHLPPHVSYVGVDAAAPLIDAAKKFPHPPNHQFILADATRKLSIHHSPFTHATIILALQNMEDPLGVFKNASLLLEKGAPCIIVLNHPCFRIPRQSSWKVDEENKIQYRRIDRYMSPMKIPIQMHPGTGKESPQTLSFHRPISDYCRLLKETGFAIDLIEEWCSTKESQGKMAKMENRSREEIPLFMAVVAFKK